MAKLSGQNTKRCVHTFANKHVNAFDMWFKLIGLPTHVRTIKHNHCGPATPFSPLCCIFCDINQVFPAKTVTLYFWR